MAEGDPVGVAHRGGDLVETVVTGAQQVDGPVDAEVLDVGRVAGSGAGASAARGDETEHGDSEDAATPLGWFRLCRDDQGVSFGLYQLPAPHLRDDAEVLTGIVDDWAQAIVAKDSDRIAGFVSDGWVIVSSSRPATKKQFLESIRDGDLTHSLMGRAGSAVTGAVTAVQLRTRRPSGYL